MACNFIKKETLAQVFFCELCEISKNTFFTEHIRMTASVIKNKICTYITETDTTVINLPSIEKLSYKVKINKCKYPLMV